MNLFYRRDWRLQNQWCFWKKMLPHQIAELEVTFSVLLVYRWKGNNRRIWWEAQSFPSVFPFNSYFFHFTKMILHDHQFQGQKIDLLSRVHQLTSNGWLLGWVLDGVQCGRGSWSIYNVCHGYGNGSRGMYASYFPSLKLCWQSPKMKE